MEICPVNAIVCLVKPQVPIDKFKSQQVIVSPSDEDFKLMLNDSDQERSWNINNCITPENNEASIVERKRLIDLALQGYNVTSLSMSQGERSSTYDQRQKDLEMTIKLLKEAIKNANLSVRFEYAFVGLDDAFIYDFRKDLQRSNDRILHRGLESIMKEVDNLDIIWTRVSRGSTLPFVLSIKITHLNTLKQGRFQMFDLLNVPFTLPVPGRTIYRSFSHFVNLTKTLSTSYHGHLSSNEHVLTNLLSHCMCGHEKLSIFLYFNDRIQQQRLKDTVSLLNLVSNLKYIPIRTMPVLPAFYTTEYRKLAQDTETFRAKEKKARELLVSHETRLTSQEAELNQKNEKIAFLTNLLKVREKQVGYLEACHDEVSNRPSMQVLKLQLALDLQKNNNKDLDFKHQLLEMECKRHTTIEIPKLEKALIESDQKFLQLEHTLKESNQKSLQLEHALKESDQNFKQLKQALEESDKKCKQLAAQMENLEKQYEKDLRERANLNSVNAENLERNINARLEKEYDTKYDQKYQDLFAGYKTKLENIKDSYKETIKVMKKNHQEDLDLVREVEKANCSKETQQLRYDLDGLTNKCSDLRRTVKELRVSLKKAESIRMAMDTAPSKKIRPSVNRTSTHKIIDSDEDGPSAYITPRRNNRNSNVGSFAKITESNEKEGEEEEEEEEEEVEVEEVEEEEEEEVLVDEDEDEDEGPTTRAASNRKTNPIKNSDDLNEEAAYIMKLDTFEKFDDSVETISHKTNTKSAKQVEKPTEKPTPRKANNKKPPPPPPVIASPQIEKPSSNSDDDFASPILPLASPEPDSQPVIDQPSLIQNLAEKDDSISFAKPIRPRRKIRKLTKPIPGTPESQHTSALLNKINELDADSQSKYDLRPVQEQAQQSLRKVGSSSTLNTSDQEFNPTAPDSSPSKTKRKAKTNPPVQPKKKPKNVTKAKAKTYTKEEAKAEEERLVAAIRARNNKK